MSNHLTESVEWYYRELADQVELDSRYQFLAVHKDFHFLTVVDAAQPSNLTLVGFGDEKPLDENGEAHSVTELKDLPEEEQTVDRQGKGVGTRLYNLPQELAGTRENPDTVTAYAFSVNPRRILELRRNNDTSPVQKVLRIGRHAGRMAEVKLLGLEHLTDRLHASFGDAQVVMQPQPPHAGLRQQLRGAKADPIVDPAFALIRDPKLGLQPIGTYHSR